MFPSKCPTLQAAKYSIDPQQSLIPDTFAFGRVTTEAQNAKIPRRSRLRRGICTSIQSTRRIIALFSTILHMSFYPMQMGRLDSVEPNADNRQGACKYKEHQRTVNMDQKIKSQTRPGCS